jgi:beta-lactamase superfamily II metal-dependent hydrolase
MAETKRRMPRAGSPKRSTKKRKGASGAKSSSDRLDFGSVSGEFIRVRMYRVGFGDCFLISLPAPDGHQHILVDCGVHSQGDIGTMREIVQDIAEESDKRLALVVATHAHQDHISGFGACEELFKQIEVGQVWLPWTEDPKDGTALKLKQKQLDLAAQLRQHMQATGVRLDDSPAGMALSAVMNAAGNEKALQLLKSGINGGTIKYFEAGKTLADAAGVEGLTVQIMGPPRDQKFLARMDPPKGDRFLRLGSNGKAIPINPIVPFEKKWKARVKGGSARPLLTEEDKKALRLLVDSSTALGFALDQALNNTSLVTLFSYRGRNLLFPGDAQYGNWQSWMNTPDGESILEHVDFFKIAHHGSHNATPKSALEKMREGFAAMISTQSRPWPSIPFDKMLKRLDEKASGVVRSDSITIANSKKEIPVGPKLKLGPGFSVGPFWCDYVMGV